jgi:hypothetical protein
VSEADSEHRHNLECLRLAYDFMQMSRDKLNPNLQAHCVRMASYWCEQASDGRAKSLVIQDDQSVP